MGGSGGPVADIDGSGVEDGVVVVVGGRGSDEDDEDDGGGGGGGSIPIPGRGWCICGKRELNAIVKLLKLGSYVFKISKI